MSEIADILAEDELDVQMMAQLHKLPKGDFIRLLGHQFDFTFDTYVDSQKVEYRFTLEEVNPRVYKNHGYIPPLP